MIQSHKILIVDDDVDDQSFLLDAITDLYPDFKCGVTSNGQEALNHIEADPPPPKLIFLDLNMPVLNGFEFLRHYRKNKNSHQSKIIVYSTSSHPRDKEISMDLGAHGYLTKLTDFATLKNVVKGLVEKYC
jgi:DNA-binding response OmpR family regulator